jgi:hypothetical protein
MTGYVPWDTSECTPLAVRGACSRNLQARVMFLRNVYGFYTDYEELYPR